MANFRVELRNRVFETKEILDNEYLDLNWSYSRIGGCGEFSFKIPRKRFEEKTISGDYNIRIYYRNPSTNSFDLWYQGLISNKIPSVRGNSESIQISGHGYQAQLSRVYLNNISYASQEASAIIKNILDNYVVPNTDITYSASDIEATSFTFDAQQFNETAMSAIEKIADTVGGMDWGVDANRRFYFKARSSTIGFRFLAGTNIQNFEDNQDFSEIVNQVLVQGAQAGGTYATFGPYSDSPSQLKYGLRATVLQNSSVTTSAVASQLATAYLDDRKEVLRKASCELVGFGERGDFNAQIEATTPIPLFAEISRKVKFGQKKFGTFLFSGIVGRLVNRVNYNLSNNGLLKINLELGQIRTSFAEQISQLEYNLEQTRSAAL